MGQAMMDALKKSASSAPESGGAAASGGAAGAEAKFCLNCGKPIPKISKFCPECGQAQG
jgi:membrane protease subunit (stomatin/prohibitin family)